MGRRHPVVEAGATALRLSHRVAIAQAAQRREERRKERDRQERRERRKVPGFVLIMSSVSIIQESSRIQNDHHKYTILIPERIVD